MEPLPNPAYNLERAPLPSISGTAIAEVAGRRGRSITLFKKLVVGFSNRRYVPAAMTRPAASIAAKYAHAWPTGLMASLATIQATKLNDRRCVQYSA